MVNALTRFGAKWRDISTTQTLTAGSGDSLSNDIVLPDTTTNLVLQLNVEQYTKLLSAALNGANIFYPDEYISVVYPLIKAGKLSFCEQTADCIDNSAAVITALNNWLLSSGNYPPLTSEITGNDALSAMPTSAPANSVTCNDAYAYAGCLATVDFMNEQNKDFLQIVIDSLADILQLIDTVLTVLPIVGQAQTLLGTDEVADFCIDRVSDLYDEYLSWDTIARREDLACRLWCYVKSDCTMSAERIALALDYFLPTSFADIFTSSVVNAITHFVTGSWVTDDIYFAMYGVQLLAYAFGGFNELGISRLYREFAANAQTEDLGYLTCDTCPSWTAEIDFRTGLHGWEIVSPNGLWVSGTGIVNNPSNSGEYLLEFNLYDGTGTAWEVLTFNVYCAPALSGSNPACQFYLKTFDDTSIVNVDYGSQTTYTWNYSNASDIDWMRFYLDNNYADPDLEPSSTVITNITISGTGFNPFEGL